MDFNTMIDVTVNQSGWILNSKLISKESLLLRLFNPLPLPLSAPASSITWEAVRAVFPPPSTSSSLLAHEDSSLLFLDWPLSVCSAILTYIQDNNTTTTTNHKQQVVVHVVGVKREVQEWPILIAVLYHFIVNTPHQEKKIPLMIDMHFIGPEIPRNVDNTGLTIHCPILTTTSTTTTTNKMPPIVTATAINVYFKRGLYQDVVVENVPDIVVGCNAGLAAYPEWLPALQHIYQSRYHGDKGTKQQLCLFTDYNEEAMERAAHMCRHVFQDQVDDVVVSEVQVNTVLQPFLMSPDDNMLPTFSNGFRVWVALLHKDKAGGELRG